jgi:outer membrane lipoprotein-sorting protein
MRNTVIALAAVLASALPAYAVDTNIKSYVCEKLDDFQATVTVVSANQRELGKISKDAGLLYRFKEVNMRYKEPNKLRAEGTVEGTRGVFILNGPMQYVSISTLKTRRNFGDEPGKRKSLMDVGLVSEYYLTYTDAKFLREAVVDGTPCAVFEMRYKPQYNDTSHHNIYIDPKTKVVRRRESYSQDGKLQAVYFFKDVKEIKPGVWFPTRIEAQNTDRVIAGVTAYKEIKVNVGIADDIFKL